MFRGCPQGGILSPILFSLFYNGVGDSIFSKFYWLFADDLSFYTFNSDISKLISDLSSILKELDTWCSARDLIINFTKTKYLIVSKTHQDGPFPSLTCRGNVSERVEEFRYLGIIFDSALSFNQHFDYVSHKVSSAIGCLHKLKRYISVETFRTLLNSFVLSIIDYGLIIWGSLCASKLDKLQSKINSLLGSYFFPNLVNKFQKISKIAKSYENHHYKIPKINYLDLYEECNILTVSERFKYFCAVFCYKSTRFDWIPELTNNFRPSNSTRNNNFLIPSHNSEFFKKSSFYQSIVVWNSLSSEAKDTTLSLRQFCRILNQWIIGKRLDEFVTR